MEEQCKQQDEVISPLLTEEGSGEGTMEGTQKPILQPIPINLDPNAIAQPKNNLLPAASSPEPVYILPSLAAQYTPKTPIAKAKASSSQLVQNLKKLVAFVQTFATTGRHWQLLTLHDIADGSGVGSEMEHLDLSNSTSSTSSSSLQRLEELVLGWGGGGGGLVSPTFFFHFILFYFDFFNLFLIFSLIFS